MTIDIREIVGAVIGEAFTLHPYLNPSNVDVIAKHLTKELKLISGKSTFVEFKNQTSIREILKPILMDCLEFRQFNISKHRWELGQRDLDTEDLYYKFPKSDDRQANDFIDLDALIQNVAYRLTVFSNAQEDCFLCKYAKEYGSMEPSDCDICATCATNPNYKYCRETHPWAKLPRNSEEYQELVKSGKITGMEL